MNRKMAKDATLLAYEIVGLKAVKCRKKYLHDFLCEWLNVVSINMFKAPVCAI